VPAPAPEDAIRPELGQQIGGPVQVLLADAERASERRQVAVMRLVRPVARIQRDDAGVVGPLDTTPV
jgi:hypothetical protein